MGIGFLAGSFARLCLAVLLLVDLFHVVNASPSSADPVRGRPSSPRPPSFTAEVKLIIATAALLVLAANAEAAAIQYNPESRDMHVSNEPSFEHKRGFYYTDLHGKKINDVASWAPSWSSFRDAHPAEPSHSREPSMMSKPAYKEYDAPQAASKNNGQYGTVKKHTTPKTAKISKHTTYTRQEPAVRYARSSPTYAQTYRLRRKRSSGDGDETLKRLADALALVTHSLLSGEHLHHPMSAEKPAQEQEEPEAVVEDEPEEQPDDNEVDPKADEVDPDKKHHDEDEEEEEEEEFKDEVDPDEEDEADPKDDDEDEDEEDHDEDDEVDTKDDDEEDAEDPEEDSKKPKKKSKKSKKEVQEAQEIKEI